MVSNIIKICKDELKLIFTDAGCQLVMVGAIFMYSIFYMMPFSNQATRDVPIGIIDNDKSVMSREFVRDLDATEYVKIKNDFTNINEAKNEYYKNKIQAFIVIPKDFERDIKRGKPSFVSTYTDSAFMIVYKQVATAVATLATEFGAKIEVGALMKKGVPKDTAIKLVMPFDFVQNPLYNPIGSYQNYIYPMVLIMLLQQTMIIGACMIGSTLREKLRGVRYREKDGSVKFYKLNSITPYTNSPVAIVLGKALAYSGLYFIYAMLYFLIFPAFVVYDMTYNILPMILMLIPYLLSCAFLGQSLVYFCSKREVSFFILVSSSVPLIFLPGFVWPKEAIPDFLNIVSKLIPFEPAADGLIKINQMGASFSQVQHDFWILVGLCLIYFVCACEAVKKMQREATQKFEDKN